MARASKLLRAHLAPGELEKIPADLARNFSLFVLESNCGEKVRNHRTLSSHAEATHRLDSRLSRFANLFESRKSLKYNRIPTSLTTGARRSYAFFATAPAAYCSVARRKS